MPLLFQFLTWLVLKIDLFNSKTWIITIFTRTRNMGLFTCPLGEQWRLQVRVGHGKPLLWVHFMSPAKHSETLLSPECPILQLSIHCWCFSVTKWYDVINSIWIFFAIRLLLNYFSGHEVKEKPIVILAHICFKYCRYETSFSKFHSGAAVV